MERKVIMGIAIASMLIVMGYHYADATIPLDNIPQRNPYFPYTIPGFIPYPSHGNDTNTTSTPVPIVTPPRAAAPTPKIGRGEVFATTILTLAYAVAYLMWEWRR